MGLRKFRGRLMTYNFSAQTNMALKKIGQHIRTME